MTDRLAQVTIGLLVVLVAGLGVYTYLAGKDAARREAELLGRVDTEHEARVEAERAKAAIDSAARLRIARLTDSVRVYRREAARADTQFTASVDTLLASVPDSLRQMVDQVRVRHERVVDRMNGQITSLNGIIAEKDRQLAARDSLIDALQREVAVQDTLIEHLRAELHPGFFESLAGDLPQVAGAVGAGVILGTVLAQ